MGAATFLDAFDALSLAFAMPVLVRLWDLDAVSVGFLIGASYIGQLVGALVFSQTAPASARKSDDRAPLFSFLLSLSVQYATPRRVPKSFLVRLRSRYARHHETSEHPPGGSMRPDRV
jgi:MFS family permease